MAVVDTGVPARRPGPRWQERLRVPGNEDALDAFPLPDPDGMLDFAAGHGAFVVGVVQQVAPEAALSVYAAVDSTASAASCASPSSCCWRCGRLR